MASSASPSLEDKEGWELALTRQRILQLLPLLPHRTGRTWLAFDERPFNGVFSFIMKQVRRGRFTNSLVVLFELLNQVIEETGWSVGIRPGSTDFANLSAYITNHNQSFERVCESLTWIVVIVECGLSYHLMMAAGVEIDWDPTQLDILRGSSIERALCRVFSSGKRPPELPQGLSVSMLETLLRLTPPNLARCISKTANTRIDNFQTMTMPLWRITQQLLDCLATVQPGVFGDLPDKALKATFADCTGKRLFFDPLYRPIILSLNHYEQSDPDRLQKSISFFFTLKSNKHVESLAYIYVRCYSLFLVFKASTQGPEAVEYRRQLVLATSNLIEFYNSRASSIDSSDVNLHLLITRSCLLSRVHEGWWNASKKNQPIWKKFCAYYRKLINSSKMHECHAAIKYFGHLAEHIYYDYCADMRSDQTKALFEIFRELYSDARSAVDRIMAEQMIPGAVSYGIVQGKIMYSTVLPEIWYHDSFSRPSALPPTTLYMCLTSLSYRFNNNDPFLPTEFKKWGNKIVTTICYCLEQSKQPGEYQSVYFECASVGLQFLRTASLDLTRLSIEAKLQLCNTLISSSVKLSSRIRDLAMWTFVQMVTMFDDEALAPLVAIHQLLCSMLEEAQQALLLPLHESSDPYGWNLQYIYDLLRARLHTTRKILNLDSTRLVLQPALESQIRAGLYVMLCSVDKHLAGKSLLCMQLIVDEVSEWTRAQLPHDSFMRQSLYDQSVFQWITRQGKTYLGHGFMMQTLTLKLCSTFSEPRLTNAGCEFLRGVRKQWAVFLTNRSLSSNANYRKTMINLKILTSWLVPSLFAPSASPNVEGSTEDGTSYVLDVVKGILSPLQYIRDATIVVLRSVMLPNPQFAMQYLQIACNGVLDSVVPAAAPRGYQITDLTIFKQLVSFNTGMVRYIQEAAKITTPVSFDVVAYHRRVLTLCRDFVFAEDNKALVDGFLSSLVAVSSASSVLVCSKFDAFEEIVNSILDKLEKTPKSIHMRVYSSVLAAALDDYTCYSSGSYTMFDSRYSLFKRIVMIVHEAMRANEGTPAFENLRKCIINVTLANQEMAVIFFEDGATLGYPHLKMALYESFELTFMEEAMQNVMHRDEEIVDVLMKDSAILQSICEVCPFNEARETIQYLCTIFCEYGREYELAQWAFAQDFEAAQYPNELFRRNSFHVQILLQLVQMNLKPAFFKALQRAVGAVYTNPFLFADVEDPSTTTVRQGESVVCEFVDACIQNQRDVFAPAVLKITKMIADKVDAKFPGYFNTAFRNLMFLRIICPVLVLPQSFGIVAHVPEGAIRDGLLYFAKYLQRLDVDSAESGPALDRVRALFSILRQGSSNSQLLMLNPPTSRSVDASFYGMHHFFYRHGRELLLQIQIYQSAGPKPLDPGCHAASGEPTAHMFNRLLTRLGRPSVTMSVDRDRSGSKRSSGRKNSVPVWLSQESQRVMQSDINGMPYLRISSVKAVNTDSPFAGFFSEFNKRLDQIKAQYRSEQFVLVVDATWDKASPDFSSLIDKAIQQACVDKRMQVDHLELLNVSFHWCLPKTKGKFSLSLLTDERPMRLHNSVDVDLDWATTVGVPEESLVPIRDAKTATKFENVKLSVNGNEILFRVFVGLQFVHVLHELRKDFWTTDTFLLSDVRFINGAIHLQRRRSDGALEFRLGLNQSVELHRKLWQVLNTSRSRYQGSNTVKPLLEVSINRFYAYIMTQCLMDIPSSQLGLGDKAAALLPWIVRQFSDQGHVDMSALITSRQVERVTAVAAEMGRAFPEFVPEFILSFIDITNKSGQLTSESVCIVKPWFELLFNSEAHSAKFEVLVRSLLTMQTTLYYNLGADLTQFLMEPLWPALVSNESVTLKVLDLYFECALFRACVISDDLNELVLCLPLKTAAIEKLVQSIFDLATQQPSEEGRFRWSGLPRWDRLEPALRVFCRIVWESGHQVMKLLPKIAMILNLFSAVGSGELRRDMHNLVNVVLDSLISLNLGEENDRRLRDLKIESNSDRGMLLWGVQSSMKDEVWDSGDGLQPEQMLRLSEFIRDILGSTYRAKDFKTQRLAIATMVSVVAVTTFIPLRLRGYYTILAFCTTKEIEELPTAWKLGRYPASSCLNPAHLFMVVKGYAMLLKRYIAVSNDIDFGKFTWSGFLMCYSGYEPLLPIALDLIKSCLQFYLARDTKNNLPFSEFMQVSCPPGWDEWWGKHSTSQISLPQKGPLFSGKLLNMILPGLQDSASARLAIETCECLLRVAEYDSDFGSTIPISLLLYVCDPHNRSFVELPSYGMLHLTFDDKLYSHGLEEKLAGDVCANPEAGVFSIIATCSMLLKHGSVASTARFLNIVCQIPSQLILQDVQPLVWPLCAKICQLIESDQMKDSIMWYERLLDASETRTEPLSASLARLRSTTERYGLPNMIGDDFSILYESRALLKENDQGMPEFYEGIYDLMHGRDTKQPVEENSENDSDKYVARARAEIKAASIAEALAKSSLEGQ